MSSRIRLQGRSRAPTPRWPLCATNLPGSLDPYSLEAERGPPNEPKKPSISIRCSSWGPGGSSRLRGGAGDLRRTPVGATWDDCRALIRRIGLSPLFSPPSPGTPRSRRRPIRGDEATPASQPCGHKGKASTRRPVPPRPMDRLLHRTGWACQAPHATQLLARVTAWAAIVRLDNLPRWNHRRTSPAPFPALCPTSGHAALACDSFVSHLDISWSWASSPEIATVQQTWWCNAGAPRNGGLSRQPPACVAIFQQRKSNWGSDTSTPRCPRGILDPPPRSGSPADIPEATLGRATAY